MTVCRRSQHASSRQPHRGSVIRDARYGLRVLRRSPVFATVAILSLALGIGANAAIFQLIDTVRFRSLPVADPQGLAEVRADGVNGFGISAGCQRGGDVSAVGADSSASNRLRIDVCLGERSIPRRPRRRGQASARTLGEWRLLSRARHHARTGPAAHGRRRSPRMRRRRGDRESRVLADASWRSRSRHRQHAHGTGSAVYRRRCHAGSVHRPRSRPVVRHRSACLLGGAVGRHSRPARPLVADRDGPAQTGLDDPTRGCLHACAEPWPSRRHGPVGIWRRPDGPVSRLSIWRHSCRSRRQPFARGVWNIALAALRPDGTGAPDHVRQSRDAHARSCQRARTRDRGTRCHWRFANAGPLADARSKACWWLSAARRWPSRSRCCREER